MPKLTIDHREIEVGSGSTILDAAHKLGIHIPTLCFREECEPSTSCMVCVVSVRSGSSPVRKLVPSCASIAEEGMVVESETEEVREARRTALELLLSDHIGDCMSPCHRTCPAGMNISLMIHQIASDRLRDAIVTVKRDIPLPASLGRICPAPCENSCRRGSYDAPVSICLLKRYAADADLALGSPYLPSCKPSNGKRVAIVGAGPTGLTAAYYLLQEGYASVVFDDHEKPGGMLRYGVSEDRLPHAVLNTEIRLIEKLGAEFRLSGEQLSVSDLQREYDAVLIASGNDSLTDNIKIDRNTLHTNLDGVFVGGNATGRKSKMAVRSVADGKTAAISINQYISGLEVTGLHKPFTVNIGRLLEGEIQRFVTGVSDTETRGSSTGCQPVPGGEMKEFGKKAEGQENRETEGQGDAGAGFSGNEAYKEAMRCLHCDCRKADDCRLRDYSEVYGANPKRYKGSRDLFEQHIQHPDVIYEPGKCIKCGLCIQITSRYREPLGLTFIGRGFNVKVGVPFSRSIAEGLQKAAANCVAVCPTGALAFKDS